jgi:probable lipoprotein NlpC
MGVLFRGPALFASPPLDNYAILAGRGAGRSAQEARNILLAAAAAYQGTPYRYGGLDRNGLDCSGFVYVSFKDSLAVSVPRSTLALYTWAEKIDTAALQPGDLVFFITQGRSVSHVGIYVGEGRFIHSASDGPNTGVIYSRLDESYWQSHFAGAGRALPEVPGGEAAAGLAAASPAAAPPAAASPPRAPTGGRSVGTSAPSSAAGNSASSPAPGSSASSPAAGSSASGGPAEKAGIRGKGFTAGIGFAPSWNGVSGLERYSPLRGVSAQGRMAWWGHIFGQSFVPGFEVRPEWDDVLGVFRTAFTLSLGFDDKLRVFVGPAFSLGSAALKLNAGDRPYTGGNAWLGAAGITAAPFSFPLSKGKLDLYGELAWQSYRSAGGTQSNWNADAAAGLRFSTGLRYTWDL